MATKRVFVVFVLPIIFSTLFGSAVMYDILQKPDRELNMWPMSFSGGGLSSHGDGPIEIIGLSEQYSASEPVAIQVKVNDPSFDCGDLYVTIYSSGRSDVITQGGFFEQCFESGSTILPVDGKFSKAVDAPGSYEIAIDLISRELVTVSISETFTVK